MTTFVIVDEKEERERERERKTARGSEKIDYRAKMPLSSFMLLRQTPNSHSENWPEFAMLKPFRKAPRAHHISVM